MPAMTSGWATTAETLTRELTALSAPPRMTSGNSGAVK